MGNKTFYHGTDHWEDIVESGAILSPWEQRIKFFNQIYTEERFKERYGQKSIEEVALEQSSESFHEEEIKHRVKCVSLTPNKIEAYEKGVVVLEVTESPSWEIYNPGSPVLFIKGKVSLDTLRGVFYKPLSYDQKRNEFKGLDGLQQLALSKAFNKYGVKIIRDK